MSGGKVEKLLYRFGKDDILNATFYLRPFLFLLCFQSLGVGSKTLVQRCKEENVLTCVIYILAELL